MKKSKIFSLIFAFVLLLSLPIVNADAAVTFKDVKQGHWSEEQINRFVEKGIINGYGDGTFRPTKALTREEAAIMLSRTLELDTTNVEAVDYKDVSSDRNSYKNIAAVTNAELMQGYNGEFNPTAPLKRQDMALVIKKAFDLQGNGKVPFTDVTKENYAHDAIGALYSNGITTGYSINTFKPAESITREQFVVFLDRALTQQEQATPSLASYLKEVYANEAKLSSYQFEGDMNFGVYLPALAEIDPMLPSLFEDIEVKMTGSYQLDPLLMDGNVTVTLNADLSEIIGEPHADGITMDMPFVMNAEKMWMKFPIGSGLVPEEHEGKYIEFDMASLTDVTGQPVPTMDLDLQTEVALVFQNLFIDYFANGLYKEVDKAEIGLENNAEIDKVVKFELTNESLVPLIDVLIKKVMPDAIELLKDPETAEALGLTAEDVALLENLETMLPFILGTDLESSISEINNFVKINELTQYDAIHKDKYILSTLMNLDIDLTMEDETMGLKMAMDFNKNNVNEPVQITIPDASETITMEELEQEFYIDEELDLDLDLEI